ncbi:hypothetical protein N9N67_07150 [Bacteriovoracaceae bacterium]|nr:hypothetical protein [Bacteriovoracaceae bacterium]
MRTLLFSSLLLSLSLFSFELTYIRGTSKDNRTFITRHGKKDGVMVGKKMTFTTDNISVIAKAITVNREFTQWEIQNKLTDIPFENGDLVTVYDSRDYLWALTPYDKLREAQKKYSHVNKNFYLLKSSLSQGVSESVSGVDAQPTDFGGYTIEGMLEREFTLNLAGSFGIRYDNETINVPEASILTQRLMFSAEITYYFNEMELLYHSRFFVGLGVAYGESLTETTGLDVSGFSSILPSTKFGVEFPLSDYTRIQFEGAIDNITSREFDATYELQTAQKTLFRGGVALKRTF